MIPSYQVARAAIGILGLSVVGIAETPRERGAYLVNTLAACADCHTPKSPSGLGPPLSGGSKFGTAEAPVYAPNITPDRRTGIGAWTDRQIVDALRLGLRPDGSRIGAPMPQTAYRFMSDSDADAIVAYLREVQPVSHPVPASSHKMNPPNTEIASPPRVVIDSEDLVARGRYIATALSHCTACHTPVPLSAPDALKHLDEGGRVFHTAKGTVVAPGIRAKDVTALTDNALAMFITKGVGPDGRKLEGPMPIRSYAGYRPSDLSALIAFLRSDQSLPE